MRRVKLFLPTLFSFTLLFLLAVGTVSCKDDKDEPDNLIGNKELNIYDFNGYRFDGIKDRLNVDYEINVDETSESISQVNYMVTYNKDGYKRYSVNFNGRENLIFMSDTPYRENGKLYLTKGGYISEMAWDVSWVNVYDDRDFFSYTDTLKFKYDSKGYLQEIKQNYKKENQFLVDQTQFPPHSYPYLIKYNQTITLTWNNGNLVNIERKLFNRSAPPDRPTEKYTYNIKYDNTPNQSLQYPFSIATSVMDDDRLKPALLLGLFGKGPANMPVSIEVIDKDGNSTINDVDFIFQDLNGLQVVDIERYQGTSYSYLFSIIK